MNSKGELSPFPNTIVAIDFEAVFGKKPKLIEYLTKDKFARTFNKEYRDLTYLLFCKMQYNVYIVSVGEDIKKYEDELWGKYIFFNQLKTYKDLNSLAFDCKNIYKYFICEKGRGYFFDNTYTLQGFKELL